MTLTPRLRKVALTAHVTFSVGWLGAVVAYLALAIAGLTSQEAPLVRAAYPAMDLIGWFVIVPLSFAALLSGLVQSLGTEWGLFRHYWIAAKLVLTVGAITVLLLHLPAVSRMSGMAAQTTLFPADFVTPRVQLIVHAGGGLLVLLVIATLSVVKPWGLTRYGRRKASEPIPPQAPATAPGRGSTLRTRWWLYVLLAMIGLILLFVVAHLAGGGMRRH
jgi:hypothetical protein